MKKENNRMGILKKTLWSCLLCTFFLPSVTLGGPSSQDVASLIGLRVTINTSEICSGGSDPDPQDPSASRVFPGDPDGCPVTLNITVEGSVENHHAGYDYVWVNGVYFFSSDHEDGECAMVTKTMTRQITVTPGEEITLLYATIDGN